MQKRCHHFKGIHGSHRKITGICGNAGRLPGTCGSDFWRYNAHNKNIYIRLENPPHIIFTCWADEPNILDSFHYELIEGLNIQTTGSEFFILNRNYYENTRKFDTAGI